MKHAWSVSLTVFACALTMGLAAQTPPAGGAQEPRTPGAQPPAASSDKNKVTVTGCLESGSASAAPTGTSGAAKSAAGAKFVLKQVTSSASPSATGTSGARAPIASSYSLDGEDSKLSPHVGHKIEVTGTVGEDRPKSDKPGEPAAAAPPMAPKLKVEAVKMIASSCTP